MKWSLPIGRYFGIGVYLHVTFLLLLGIIATGSWLVRPGGVVDVVGFYLAVFGCVLLHEFGHALTARRFGIKTRDITLLPIGGLARLEKMPDKPFQEFLVAIAGPAVNIAIALVLLPFVLMNGGFKGPISFVPGQGSFLESLLLINLWLVAFNMLPAFPMDGGRVLRSLLAMKIGNVRATFIAARVGQAMAVLFMVAGFALSHFVLMIIAVFVWMGAAQENEYAQMRGRFEGLTAGQVMQKTFARLEPNDTLARAAHLFQHVPQAAYPVLWQGQLVGLLAPEDLIRAVGSRYLSEPVSVEMRSDVVSAEAGEPLESVLARLQAASLPVAVIVQDGTVVGLLGGSNVAHFLGLREALDRFHAGNTRPRPTGVTPPPMPNSIRPV